MGAFDKLREKLFGARDEFYDETPEEGYIEINTAGEARTKAKIVVRPFIISDFQDIKHTLDALREGYTIALVNIKPIKDKDIVELKRAINKLKKTCDAIEGDIAGFGEDWIVVTPSFAEVHRTPTIQREPEPRTQFKNI